MDDQLDEELKNRIKKVFDGFEDPLADEGWKQLKEKFPAARNRRPVAWMWWSAAALLLLALGFGIWKYSANSGEQNFAGTKKLTPPQKTNLPASKPVQTPTQTSERQNSPAADAGAANIAKLRKPQHGQAAGVKSPGDASAHNDNLSAKPSPNLLANNMPPGSNQVKSNKQGNKTTDTAQRIVKAPAIDQLAATRLNTGNNQTAANKPAGNAQPAKPNSVAAMLANNTPEPKKVTYKPSRIRLGVYAASFVNYAKGSGNQGNVGAGFSAELSITKNLKLVSGITLAQNSLSYNGGVPGATAGSSLFPSSNSPGAAIFGNLSTFSSASAVTIASVPAFKSYGVSMFNIDVPVNLKLDFNPKRNDIYLMAGISSGTFANESYTYYYNYPALPSPALQAPHAETSKSYFDNFYFAKMLNVAVGYGYQVGRNHLIIEPFVKYPLGGLGMQNIRFGAGGINLKLNFPTK